MYHFLSLFYDSNWDCSLDFIILNSLVQIGRRIRPRKPDRGLITEKNNLLSYGFYRSTGSQNENKRKQKHKQICEPCQRANKVWNMRLTVIPIGIGVLFKKKSGGPGNQRMNRDHSDYRINIGLNTQKNSADLRWLVVSQTNQLKLVCKSFKKLYNDMLHRALHLRNDFRWLYETRKKEM